MSRARRRLRTLLRKLLRVVTGLLVFAAAGVAFLHTPPGSALARTAIERIAQAAFGQDVHLGDIDFRLWRGEVEFAAVTLHSGGTVFSVQRGSLRWEPSGLVAHLVLPSVVVTDTTEASLPGSNATGLAAQPWRVLERFREVQIDHGRLELRDEAGHPWLVLPALNARMAIRDGHRAVDVSLSGASAGWPGGGLRVSPLDVAGHATLDDGRLTVHQLRLTSGATTLELDGVIHRMSPFEATATAHGTLDGSLFGVLAPGTQLSGLIDVQTAVEVSNETVKGTLEASAPALAVQGLGPWAAEAHGHFEGARFALDSLTARGFGGRIDASGPLALLPTERTAPRITIQNLDPAALVAALSGSALPVASRVDGSLEWSTQGWDMEAARGKGRVSLRPAEGPGLPVEGHAQVELAGFSLGLREVHVEARGARLDGELRLDHTGALLGQFETRLPLQTLPALAADVNVPLPEGAFGARGSGVAMDPDRPNSRLDGALLAQVSFAGSNVGRLTASAHVTSENLAFGRHPMALDSEARYEDGRLAFDSLVLRSGRGSIGVVGQLPVAANGGDFALEGVVDGVDFAPFADLLGVDGQGLLSGKLSYTGPQLDPTARASLRATLDLPNATATRAAAKAKATTTMTADLATAAAPAHAATATAGTEAGAHATARATAVTVADPPPSATTRVILSLDGTYRRSRIEIQNLDASLAGGRLLASGSFDTRTEALTANIQATELTVAALPLLPPGLSRMSGELAVEASVSGTTRAPSGSVRIDLTKAGLDGSPVPSLRFAAAADGRSMTVAASADTVFLTGQAPLEGDWPMDLRIDAAALPLQGLLDALADPKRARPELTATGTVSVRVPLLHPGQLTYFTADLAAQGKLRDLSWRTEPIVLAGDGRAVKIEALRLDAEGSHLQLSGTVGLSPNGALDLEVDSSLEVKTLGPALGLDGADGQGSARVHVAGTVAEPHATGEARLTNVRGRSGGFRWRNLEAHARFVGAAVEVDQLEARLLGGRLSASGRVPFPGSAATSGSRLTFRVEDVDLTRIVDRDFSDPTDAALLVSLEGEADARTFSLDGLNVRGRFTRLEAKSAEGSLRPRLAGPVAPPPRTSVSRSGSARGSGRTHRAPGRRSAERGQADVRGWDRGSPGPRCRGRLRRRCRPSPAPPRSTRRSAIRPQVFDSMERWTSSVGVSPCRTSTSRRATSKGNCASSATR